MKNVKVDLMYTFSKRIHDRQIEEEPQILTCLAEVFAPTLMTSEYLTKYTTSYSQLCPASRATGE
jgi:hypothetical protein